MAHQGAGFPNSSNAHTAQNDFLTADIFEYLGLTGLSPTQKAQLLATMLETIQSRVVGRLLDVFKDDADRTKLEDALAKKDTDTINVLLASRGLPQMEELVAEEVVMYKLEVMKLFQEA